MAFSPDGKRLASVGYSDAFVKVWNLNKTEELLTPKGDAKSHVYFNCVAYRPDGKLLAAAGNADDSESKSGFSGIIILRDPVTWKVTRRLKGHKSDVYRVAFSPDGKRLASGSENGTIKLWDVSDGSK